ncbi:hypothetical protein E3_0110 [Rhodococcus phage E3]|uniref:hypothetical protein n=1 Tax=Rhodococcus phage E3 TaxID=1007869 RepID=UPI0002C6986F|nr:hypothetical protein M176_gp011 [Rhodococcus phage E3]AEQ20921.1 hypothetical protein E3_0110 [Rhodococcus phage E3]
MTDRVRSNLLTVGTTTYSKAYLTRHAKIAVQEGNTWLLAANARTSDEATQRRREDGAARNAVTAYRYASIRNSVDPTKQTRKVLEQAEELLENVAIYGAHNRKDHVLEILRGNLYTKDYAEVFIRRFQQS